MEAFRHTPCYCEENVWRLCEDLLRGRLGAERAGLAASAAPPPPPGRLCAVFVSNKQKRVPMWHQQAGGTRSFHGAPGFVLWDYHVFAVLDTGSGGHGTWVLDLDSTLRPFPTPFVEYTAQALRPELLAADGHGGELPSRRFRVVDAGDYLGTLCSDRSHMRMPCGGWLAQPPPEPAILCNREGCADGRTSNLFAQFVSMEPGSGVGEVLEEESFLRRFGWEPGV